MDFNNWLSFAAASMLILILPGPTILTILSHTLTGGRRVIWAAVAAVACGDLISMSSALALCWQPQRSHSLHLNGLGPSI